MIVANCPRCFDPVRIPDELPGAAQMRCPLCQAEFDLSEILDHLPPALEVVGTPQLEPVGAEALASVASGGSSVLDESIAAEGSGISFGFLNVGHKRPSDTNDRADAPKAFTLDTAASASVGGEGISTSLVRPTKRKSGGMMLLVKTFLGGAVGLSIAFFAILWLPFFPDNDPFGAAHFLPDWMVPARVREASDYNGSPTAETGDTNTNTRTRTPGVHRGTIITPEDGVVRIPSNRPPRRDRDNDHPFGLNPDPDDAETTDPFGRPRGGGENPGNSGENDPFSIDNEPSIDPEFFGPSQFDPDPLDLGPELFPEEDYLGVLNAPSYEPRELGLALRAARDAKRVWNESGGISRDERKILAAEFYEALCEMAEKVTFTDPDDPTAGSRRDAVMGLLLDIGSDNDFAVAGYFGGHQLDARRRSTDGIVIAGTVVAIELEGELYNTRVELATRDDEKPVYSIMGRTNPLEPPATPGRDSEPGYQVGSKVLICGWVVEIPEINLGGYTGDEPLVIWSGLSVEVESP